MSLLHPDGKPPYIPPPASAPSLFWRVAGLLGLTVIALALVSGALVAVQEVQAILEPGGIALARWPW